MFSIKPGATTKIPKRLKIDRFGTIQTSKIKVYGNYLRIEPSAFISGKRPTKPIWLKRFITWGGEQLDFTDEDILALLSGKTIYGGYAIDWMQGGCKVWFNPAGHYSKQKRDTLGCLHINHSFINGKTNDFTLVPRYNQASRGQKKKSSFVFNNNCKYDNNELNDYDDDNYEDELDPDEQVNPNFDVKAYLADAIKENEQDRKDALLNSNKPEEYEDCSLAYIVDELESQRDWYK